MIDPVEPEPERTTEVLEAPPPGGAEAHAHAETAEISADDEVATIEAVEATEPEAEDAAVGEGREAPERLKSIVESLLFASDKPIQLKRVQELTGERDVEKVRAAIEWLRADYADRGVVLHEVSGGYQFRTNPLNAFWVQQLIAGKPVRLTRAQLESLAIVSYRQPITRPEIDEIRGVDSGGTLKVLLDRGLIRVMGKKEEPGRPMLYGTTKEFLEFFNLRDLKDLPTLREFHELSEESLARIKKHEDASLAAQSESSGPPPEQAS